MSFLVEITQINHLSQLEEDKIVLAAQAALEAQGGEVADGDVDINGA